MLDEKEVIIDLQDAGILDLGITEKQKAYLFSRFEIEKEEIQPKNQKVIAEGKVRILMDAHVGDLRMELVGQRLKKYKGKEVKILLEVEDD